MYIYFWLYILDEKYHILKNMYIFEVGKKYFYFLKMKMETFGSGVRIENEDGYVDCG